MDFVPMTSIAKKPDSHLNACFDWVATEKVHGSSFQIYTDDGSSVHVGSRRRPLEKGGSFLKCNINNLLKDYEECVVKAWHLIHSDDQWREYREHVAPLCDDDDEADDDNDNVDGGEKHNNDDNKDGDSSNSNAGSKDDAQDHTTDQCLVRVYGELYGGGGIKIDARNACQREIIYCDDFRFYVFGITVNRNWLTIRDLNLVCHTVGFPYYAKPINAKGHANPDDLIQWIKDNGYLNARSSLTEKDDNVKTSMEGVVMTPTVRPDFRLHAVKFLFPQFNDVRTEQLRNPQNKSETSINYCTRQRYHSVISKLDLDERKDTEMVARMFVDDIIKESPDKRPSERLQQRWRECVARWQKEEEEAEEKKARRSQTHKDGGDEKLNDDVEEDGDDGNLLGFDMFS